MLFPITGVGNVNIQIPQNVDEFGNTKPVWFRIKRQVTVKEKKIGFMITKF
jgi:hypothetical protein